MTITAQRSIIRPVTTPVAMPADQPEEIPADDPRIAVRMTETVARFAVEIVRDVRASATLSRLVSPEILTMLERRRALTRRLRGGTAGTRGDIAARVVLRSVRTCIVDERTVEASAVLCEPDRARFIALRWELRARGWRVTVLEIG